MIQHDPTIRRAFTLIELLVAMIIVTSLVALSFPMIGAMKKGTGIATGINVISVGVTATRAYATRQNVNMSDTGDPKFVELDYSGTALIVTPSHEMRIVENNQFAVNGDGNLLEKSGYNGYVDIQDLEYLTLPKDTGLVGIARNTDEEPALMTPPFAIAFNSDGQLVVGRPNLSTRDRVVCYDGDYNGRYVVSRRRTNPYGTKPYDPDAWRDVWNDDVNEFELPFEVIDTVVGVVAYSESELRGAGHTLIADEAIDGEPLNAAASRWILENGEAVFFNRYTGAPMRE